MTTILRGCVGSITSAAPIKALQEHGVRVVGMDSDPYSVGFHLCDAYYLVPLPTDPGYISFILDICIKEKVDAILPSAEEEILPLADSRALFAVTDIKLLCPSYRSSMVCADKQLTYQYFEKEGIPYPERYQQDNALFPCIVKPQMGRGGKGVFVVEDQTELDMRMARNPKLIIQEYVDGITWAIDTLADWDGTILSMVSRRKILQKTGAMVKGITERNEEAMEYSRRFTTGLKLTGPAMSEYIVGKDGLKFFEINTRFGGGGAPLMLAADPTIIPNLVRMIEDKPGIPSTGFTEGLMVMSYYAEVFTQMEV